LIYEFHCGRARVFFRYHAINLPHPAGDALTCVKVRNETFRHVDSVKTKNDLAQARLTREWRTMTAMVEIFCRGHHRPAQDLCAECRQFLEYVNLRLERCQFGVAKPVCAKCPVHCYQRERREQVRVIMRYAGPRMLWQHPVMSLRHWLDRFRKAPSV
jgi:Nitrous oxide-stimulated promoter